MELDNQLYRHHSVKVTSSRAVDGLHDGAATFICLIQDELDRWFFNDADASKNWLSNDAVLAATIVTPGGAAMLRKAASRAGQDDPIGRARTALLRTAERLLDEDAEVASRQEELERERKRCRTTLVDWESDASRAADAESTAEIVMQELERFVAMHATAIEGGAVDFWSAHGDDYPHLQLVACAVQMLPSGVAAAIRGRRHVAGVAGGARERRPVCGGAPHRERQVVNEDDAAHRKRHVVDDVAEACRRLRLFDVVASDTRGRQLTAGAAVVSRPLGAVHSDDIDGRQR